jgi:hypothetical protein
MEHKNILPIVLAATMVACEVGSVDENRQPHTHREIQTESIRIEPSYPVINVAAHSVSSSFTVSTEGLKRVVATAGVPFESL